MRNYWNLGWGHSSRGIHWHRRIETLPQIQPAYNRSDFQRNPLTQKDWNCYSPTLFIVVCYLPEESIDTEGLKRFCNMIFLIPFVASRGIHWHRRIETYIRLVSPHYAINLPEESIDTEGLKLKHLASPSRDCASSRGIHWHRRIETADPQEIIWHSKNFQRNPLTQKDWNFRKTLAIHRMIYASRGIHWHRRIETPWSAKRVKHPDCLPEESIDTEGLKQ